MVSTHSPYWQESFLQAAEWKKGNTWEFFIFRTTLRFLFKKGNQEALDNRRILPLTCVAQSGLRFGAPFVVPLALLCAPSNVHLHTILIYPRWLSISAIVWFILGPIGCFFCQRLVGAHPGPDLIDLADADPVVVLSFRQKTVEILNLLLVLDGHQVCVVLLAPGACLTPVHGGVGVVVGPALYTSPHAQHWGQKW